MLDSIQQTRQASRKVLIAAALASALTGLTTGTASAAASDPEMLQRIAARASSELESRFVLPRDLPIEPALREALDTLSKSQMPRMTALVRQWTTEAAAKSPSQGSVEGFVVQRLRARLANEMALMYLESPGAEYDEVLLGALRQPAYCRSALARFGWARQAILLQAVDLQKRDVMLAGEKELLARWGTTRIEPPSPSPLSEVEQDLIARLRTNQASSAPPMPPVLAWSLLVNKPPALDPDVGCALHQWALVQGLTAAKQSPKMMLQAYRYAALPLADPSLNPPDGGQPLSADGYPVVAVRFGVEGKVTVRMTLDADGKPQRALVVRRDITVDGERGSMAGLETLLDEASIARASAIPHPKPEASALKDGVVIGDQVISWRLE
jgi:hypothetical protein